MIRASNEAVASQKSRDEMNSGGRMTMTGGKKTVQDGTELHGSHEGG